MSARGRFAGQGAVVTGASSGIGRAVALAFAREGAEVLLTYRRNAEGAQEVARPDPGSRRPGLADRGRPLARGRGGPPGGRGFQAPVPRARLGQQRGGGHPDRGGGFPDGRREARPCRSAWTCEAPSSAPGRRRHVCAPRGAVSSSTFPGITSSPGPRGAKPRSTPRPRGASSRSARAWPGPSPPRSASTCWRPGWIATAFAAGLPEEERRRIAEATPLRRWGTPEDVAQAALFLASGEAGFLTGATVLVNGGTVM